MSSEKCNLPNNGYDLCECGWAMVNGICSNPDCPTKQIYNNGYRAKADNEVYPIINIE
jgi:hypothetical protein